MFLHMQWHKMDCFWNKWCEDNPVPVNVWAEEIWPWKHYIWFHNGTQRCWATRVMLNALKSYHRPVNSFLHFSHVIYCCPHECVQYVRFFPSVLLNDSLVHTAQVENFSFSYVILDITFSCVLIGPLSCLNTVQCNHWKPAIHLVVFNQEPRYVPVSFSKTKKGPWN